MNVYFKLCPHGIPLQDLILEKSDSTIIIKKWDDEKLGPRPSEEELKIAFDELVSYYAEYKINRRKEYPPIEDYIDGVVKGDQAQIQEYIDKCLEVKRKYPKTDQSTDSE